LTDWKPQLENFFVVGEELATYKNEAELFQLVPALLGDEREQARLRAAGYARALQSHTFSDRCREIIARVAAQP
jgi:spore maturation protein CgeB